MIIADDVFTLGMIGLFLTIILYVLFGQITVKKLRRNPETSSHLGLEFASGWDIFNVAQALALPRFITKKLAESPLSVFYANSSLLEKNTSRFDKWLACIFYWLFTASIISIFSSAFI
ncbi:MAG: hypothetical protein GY820_14375 [Gammaproteobacteria bacterium]|nr:hypothetical protein [Gammaproteobacteria bacterium]